MANTLLLTGTISPYQKLENKLLKDLNVEERKKDYIRALLYYITQSNFSNIIFCENSNTNIIEFESIKNIAKLFNKNLEILLFSGNTNLVIQYGYGAGEAEIFDYVFENSQIMETSSSFYKITGRYIVKDINTIIKKLDKFENYFHKQGLFMTQFTFSTAFFKISKANYQKYLYKKQIKLYQDLDKKNYKNEIFFKNHFPLERVWYCLLRDKLIKYNQEFSFPVFYDYPKINSYGFNENIRNLIYKIYCYLKLNQYGLFHKIIDKLLYRKTYKKMINDNLFN